MQARKIFLIGPKAAFMAVSMVLTATPAIVSAQEGSIPEYCTGRQPDSLVLAQTCKLQEVDCFELEHVLNKEFPGSTNSVEFRQDKDTYVALRFSTEGLTHKSGRWVFETAQFDARGQGPKLMSISTCPGDFDEKAIESEMGENCLVHVSGLNQLIWIRAGANVSDFRERISCKLHRDNTYYLNIMYTSQPKGTPPSELVWDCSGNKNAANCGNLMAASYTQ